jgi:hypothetical protein
MPVITAPRLSVSHRERKALKRMADSTSLPHRTVVQASALVLAADGVANGEIARQCSTPYTVRRWRRKFEEGGLDAVGSIAAGRGRKPTISHETIDAIVHDTLVVGLYLNPPERAVVFSFEAIDVWVSHWNHDPKPFMWAKTATEIVTKVRGGRAALTHQTKSATDH